MTGVNFMMYLIKDNKIYYTVQINKKEVREHEK